MADNLRDYLAANAPSTAELHRRLLPPVGAVEDRNGPYYADWSGALVTQAAPASMSVEATTLADLVWDGFSTSPFFDITMRDAESIAATVLASQWLAQRDAKVRTEERERIAQAIEAEREGVAGQDSAAFIHRYAYADAARIAREVTA